MTACTFRFFRKVASEEVASPDLGRRRTITGLAAGAAAVPLMRANTGHGQEPQRAAAASAGRAG